MASEARAARAGPASLALLLLALLAGSRVEGQEEGPPLLPQPGERIDHRNLKRYEHLLPEHAIRWIRDGAWFGEEGRTSITVGETRPAPLPASFLAASALHAGEARLGEDGVLEGWQAGLPFPEPSEPELGAKILWNQYYRWRGDETVIDTYRTTQTDRWGNRRETRGVFQLLTVAGRTDRDGPTELAGNGRGIRTASKLVFTYPSESRWQTTLSYRYRDPTRDDDVWIYLPSTRRVLRVQGGRRCSPVRGSDFTPDDFFGFDGRVWEHRWRVVHEGPALALVHQAAIPPELDARGAWPVGEAWELREVWVVEGVPKDPGYCYGRRRLWIDKENFEVLHADVWDPGGVYWKGFLSTYGHGRVENGESAPIWAGTGATDFQNRHLTFVSIGEPELGVGYRIGGQELGFTDFTPAALRRLGR
jgi:hypothetical protein